MLPIDDDILLSRYGDDPVAAKWYQGWRTAGAQPDEAMRATDEMRRLVDRLPYFPPSISQQQAIQRYADACADGIKALQEAQAYRAPSDQEIAAPLTPDAIKRLADEAQQVMALIRKQLTHSHRSSTDTDNSNP